MVTEVREFIPTEKQYQAAASTARWVLYGGAWGGGKTRWLVETVIDLLLDNPGIEGVLARHDSTDLMAPTQAYDVFHRVINPRLLLEEYRSPPRWVRLREGSRLTLTGLKDYLPSAEYGFIAVDQAEEVPQDTLKLLDSRLRQVLPDGRRPQYKVLLTCNPHPNMEWFLAEAARNDDFEFIPALPSDNPHLPSDYVERQKAILSEDRFRKFILGSWDVFEGQAIPEFDRNLHVVEPFSDWRTYGWPVHRGIDHGLNHPTVCEWIAVSPEGDLFVTQEYERADESVANNAKAIAAMSIDMRLGTTWIDPRTQQRQAAADATDWTPLKEYQDQGVWAQAALGTRENRLAAIRQVLKPNPMRRHYLTHRPPAPQLYIFANCERLIWELPRLKMRTALQGYEDVEKIDDDAYDAVGFVATYLMNRGNTQKQRAPYIGVKKG